MVILKRLMVMVAGLGVLGGCATARHAESQVPSKDVQTYLKYAGPPIDRFTYLGRYDGFRTLGGQYVVIWTTFRDPYLIKVLDPCTELPFADRVGLTSTASTVSSHFDAVLVGHDRCRIDTIQRIDYDAMRKDHVAGP